jgi:hypothetical protein
MYELSIIIARYVNPTTEVTARELARDEDDETNVEEEESPTEETDEHDLGTFENPDDHPENGHDRDL